MYREDPVLRTCQECGGYFYSYGFDACCSGFCDDSHHCQQPVDDYQCNDTEDE